MNSTDPSTPRRRRAPVRRLALALAAFAVGCVAAEGLHRGWLAVRGTPHDAASMREHIETASDPDARYRLGANGAPAPAQGKPVTNTLHPYSGSERHHDTGGVLAYFRRGTIEDAYKVLIVGGSVAAGLASFNAGEDGLFARLLRRDPRWREQRVFVLNYAHVSYKQPQQLTRVAYLLSLGYKPDAIINIDGFNEIAAGDRNVAQGIHPAYPTPVTWELWVRDMELGEADLAARAELFLLAERARVWGARSARFGLHRSSVLASASLGYLRRLNDRRARLQLALSEGNRDLPAWVRGPDYSEDGEAILSTCAQVWSESSLSLEALCAARDIAYLHVLQPTLNDPSSKELSPEEEQLPLGSERWIAASRAGYPILRERGRELAESGVCFFDATRVFADVAETAYCDACHLVPLGERVFTEAIAAAFLDCAP